MSEKRLGKRTFCCQYCGKKYKLKAWFDQHNCVARENLEGVAKEIMDKAFKYWAYWMRKQNMIVGGKEPEFSKFQASMHKTSFISLAHYIQNRKLSENFSLLYIDWLVESRIPSRDWYNDSIKFWDKFQMYVNEHENPQYHVQVFAKEVQKWVSAHPGQTSDDFFNQLTPGVVLNMVRQRKIKPWVLFTFNPIYSRLEESDYVFRKIKDVVDCDYWADKIQKEPNSVQLTNDMLGNLLWERQM